MAGPPFLDADDIRLIDEWITQGARNTDGKPARLTMGGRTRIDRDSRGGGYTQVRGHLDGSGRVVVERLRGR